MREEEGGGGAGEPAGAGTGASEGDRKSLPRRRRSNVAPTEERAEDRSRRKFRLSRAPASPSPFFLIRGRFTTFEGCKIEGPVRMYE